MDREEAVLHHFETSADVIRRTGRECGESIVAASVIVVEAFSAGGKLLLCGNGGSAAQAQHLTAELVGVLDKRRPRGALAAITLGAEPATLTAVANDFGFEQVFARQIEALGRKGDVLLAISTSGGSANVIQAARAARKAGLRVVALTGSGGGALAKHADTVIAVPDDDVQYVQEAHGVIAHVLCALIERGQFPSADPMGRRASTHR